MINCFRYLSFESLYDVEVLTLEEYSYRMKAYNLSKVDYEYRMHMQAWLNHQVTLTEKVGKKTVPIFEKFEEFFDYGERIKALSRNNVEPLDSQSKKLARLAAKTNEGGR